MIIERWPIIDTHFHVGVNLINQFICEEDLIPYLNETDIDYQVICQINEGFVHKTPEWNPYIGNDYIAKVQKMFPKRVIGLGTVNPWYQPPNLYRFPSKKVGQKFDISVKNECLEEVDRCFIDLGLWGLKLHPFTNNFPINDPYIIFPILDRMVQLQKVVNRKFFLTIHCGGDSMYNSPESIAMAAKEYPDILFIALHTAILLGWETAPYVFGKINNLLMDLTISPLTNIIFENAKKLGPQKFSIGTDGPFDTFNLKKIILNQVFSNHEDQELVEGGNIAKWIGIQKVNTPKRKPMKK